MGLLGGQVVKALDYGPRVPRFQPQDRDLKNQIYKALELSKLDHHNLKL